jgi:hypothetical protein
MRRWLATAGIAALCMAPLGADVTITQTTSVEGGMMPAATQGAAPKMVMRIKGTKMRTDFEVMGQNTITIVDAVSRQVIVLDAARKTAQIITPEAAAAAMPAEMPKMDVSFKATGQSKSIEGAQCDEHTFTMTMDMSEMGGPRGKMPPEAAAMMKDVQMMIAGTVWVAKSGPGTADYVALQKAAIAANMAGALTGAGTRAPGGMEKMLAAAASAPGLPYLTEINTSFSGTGPMVQMLQQSGTMKITQKVTSVSTDAITDDMFTVPPGYQVEKK